MGLIAIIAVVTAIGILLVVTVVAARFARSRSGLEQRLRLPDAQGNGEQAAFELQKPYELLQSRHGPMLVNSNDNYLGKAIILYGECCELEVDMLLQLISIRPGAVVEVGANIGTHTVPIARALHAQGRHLIAFEPQPVIFQNMCANLALNALSNVTAWPFACGDRKSTLYFSMPDYLSGGNFGEVSMKLNASAKDIAVPCHALDDILEPGPVSMIKIDVEGFELAVLAGALKTLKRHRPVLYVENDRADKSSALIEWLWSKNYRLWWHAPSLFNPDNFFQNKYDAYPKIVSLNMVCLPREMPSPISGLTEILSKEHPLMARSAPSFPEEIK